MNDPQPKLEKIALRRDSEVVEVILVSFSCKITSLQVGEEFKRLGLRYGTYPVLRALQEQRPDLLTSIWAVALGQCELSNRMAKESPVGPLIPHTWTFDDGAEIHWGPIDREWPEEARFIAFG